MLYYFQRIGENRADEHGRKLHLPWANLTEEKKSGAGDSAPPRSIAAQLRTLGSRLSLKSFSRGLSRGFSMAERPSSPASSFTKPGFQQLPSGQLPELASSGEGGALMIENPFLKTANAPRGEHSSSFAARSAALSIGFAALEPKYEAGTEIEMPSSSAKGSSPSKAAAAASRALARPREAEPVRYFKKTASGRLAPFSTLDDKRNAAAAAHSRGSDHGGGWAWTYWEPLAKAVANWNNYENLIRRKVLVSLFFPPVCALNIKAWITRNNHDKRTCIHSALLSLGTCSQTPVLQGGRLLSASEAREVAKARPLTQATAWAAVQGEHPGEALWLDLFALAQEPAQADTRGDARSQADRSEKSVASKGQRGWGRRMKASAAARHTVDKPGEKRGLDAPPGPQVLLWMPVGNARPCLLLQGVLDLLMDSKTKQFALQLLKTQFLVGILKRPETVGEWIVDRLGEWAADGSHRPGSTDSVVAYVEAVSAVDEGAVAAAEGTADAAGKKGLTSSFAALPNLLPKLLQLSEAKQEKIVCMPLITQVSTDTFN